MAQLDRLFYIFPANAHKFVYLPAVISGDAIYGNALYGASYAAAAPCYAQPVELGGTTSLQVEYATALVSPSNPLVLSIERDGLEVHSIDFTALDADVYGVDIPWFGAWASLGGLYKLYIRQNAGKLAESEPISLESGLNLIEYSKSGDSAVFGYDGFAHKLYARCRKAETEESEKEVYTDSKGGETLLNSVIKPGTFLEFALSPSWYRRILRYALATDTLKVDGVRHTPTRQLEEEKENNVKLGLSSVTLLAYKMSSNII